MQDLPSRRGAAARREQHRTLAARLLRPGRVRPFVVSDDLAAHRTCRRRQPFDQVHARRPAPSRLRPAPPPAPALQACAARASSLDPAPLLQTAAGLVDDALSCGFTGIVMLHGALAATGGRGRWAPTLLAAARPTYYGMLAALMEPRT